MANHKSAAKRAKQSEIKRIRNRSVKTKVKNTVKDLRAAVKEETVEGVAAKLDETKSIIDNAAKKGVIHKNTASRKISRLTKLVNSANA